MQNYNLPVAIRPADPNDYNFIYDNWRKSFRESDFAHHLPNEIYFPLQKGKMETHIQQAQTHIACLDNDPDCIFGFITHDKHPEGYTIVHYIYTKWRYRKAGIARKLLAHINPTAPTIFTDITPKFIALRNQHHLPYITAREYEDFIYQSPEDPTIAFNKWYKDQFYRHRQQPQSPPHKPKPKQSMNQ